MLNFFKNFRKDDSGAVTVDWVVLTAAIVAMAVAGYGGIKSSTETVAAAAASGIDTAAAGL